MTEEERKNEEAKVVDTLTLHTLGGKTPHQLRVEEFMQKAKQEVPSKPVVPSEAVRKLRAKLILEEALETVDALGINIKYSPVGPIGEKIRINDFFLEENVYFDELECLSEVIDGCADLSVVTTGTLSAFGVPDLLVLQEVDNNNLAKFGPGHSWREDGKLVKPPGHKPPDWKVVLERIKQA